MCNHELSANTEHPNVDFYENYLFDCVWGRLLLIKKKESGGGGGGGGGWGGVGRLLIWQV